MSVHVKKMISCFALLFSFLSFLPVANALESAPNKVWSCQYMFEAYAGGLKLDANKSQVPKAPNRMSYAELNQWATDAIQNIMMPRYTNPKYEIKAQETWKGIAAPRIIDDLLVPGTTLIAHSLNGSMEPGAVKNANGGMVHLRYDMGGGEATNIGVSIRAVMANRGKVVKSYVRDEARAVLIFIHGGGTNTTGHHVAAQLMDFLKSYNIDVISIDLPHHGEGQRTSKESALAELLRTEAIVRGLVGNYAGPKFLGGHSMGGIFTSINRRELSDRKYFAGFIPLSTVADPVPNGTLEEKLEAERRITEFNKTNPNIPKSERDLTEKLIRQLKISPTCGVWCDMFISALNWDIPKHNGKDWAPALYIIGEGDGLYQGYEKAFQMGVANLDNTELVVYTPRVDVKSKNGEKTIVGHLIFDHRVPIEFAADVTERDRYAILSGKFEKGDARKSKDPKNGSNQDKEAIHQMFEEYRKTGRLTLEDQFSYDDVGSIETFARIKNFIGKVTGQKMDRVAYQSEPLEEVSYTYINNLAFRIFADSHMYLYQQGNEHGTAATARFQQLNEAIKKAEGQLNDNKNGKHATLLTAEEVAGLEHNLKNLKAERSILEPILAHKGIIEDPAKLAEFEELGAQISAIRSQIQKIRDPSPLKPGGSIPVSDKGKPLFFGREFTQTEYLEAIKQGMKAGFDAVKNTIEFKEGPYIQLIPKYVGSAELNHVATVFRDAANKLTKFVSETQSFNQNRVMKPLMRTIADQKFLVSDIRAYLNGEKHENDEIHSKLGEALSRTKLTDKELLDLGTFEELLINYSKAWAHFYNIRDREERAGRVVMPVDYESGRLSPLHQRNSRGEPELRSSVELANAYEAAKQTMKGDQKYIGMLENYAFSKLLKEARDRREKIFAEMLKQHELVFTITRAYLVKNFSEGRFSEGMFENLPPEILSAFDKYQRLAKAYGSAAERFSVVLIEEGLAGRLAITDLPESVRADVVRAYGEDGADSRRLRATIVRLKGTMEELKNIKSNLDQRTKMIAYFQGQEFNRVLLQSKISGDSHFITRTYTVKQLLNLNPSIFAGPNGEKFSTEFNNLLQRIWSDWTSIYSGRVIDQTEGADGFL